MRFALVISAVFSLGLVASCASLSTYGGFYRLPLDDELHLDRGGRLVVDVRRRLESLGFHEKKLGDWGRGQRYVFVYDGISEESATPAIDGATSMITVSLDLELGSIVVTDYDRDGETAFMRKVKRHLELALEQSGFEGVEYQRGWGSWFT